MSSTTTTEKDLIYTVSEDEHRRELAKGVNEDESLKPGKYVVRRSRFVHKTKNSKSKISLYVDDDILNYFRTRAEKPDAAPYQTQINNELRRVMENDIAGVKSVENDILNDEEFLRALKSKLETI